MLTFGCAVYNDFDSLFFTFIRLLDQVRSFDLVLFRQAEFIVVDNCCSDASSELTRRFCEKNKIKYIPFPNPPGPALAKEQIIKNATREYVVIFDSHVYFLDGSVAALFSFLHNNPNFDGLIYGGIKGDFYGATITHYLDLWSGEFWGKPACSGFSVDRVKLPIDVWAAPTGLMYLF